MLKYNMNSSNISNIFKTCNVHALEMFSAAWCNLDCKYCYIPKHNNLLLKIHKKIMKNIIDGTLLKKIESIYGNELTHISHWGTEPTLTLSIYKKFYDELFKMQPKLAHISFSSNFMKDPIVIENFIKSLPNDRSIKIDIQMSLDGPGEITNKNRRNGSVDTIVSNILKFVKIVGNMDTNHIVSAKFKPTIGIDDLYSLSNFKKLNEYYSFFDDLIGKIISEPGKIKFSINVNPTLVTPQDYTSEDGKTFFKMLQIQNEMRNHKNFKYIIPDCSYFGDVIKITKFHRELYTKSRMFTCSAGDSCFSLDEEFRIQPCHRTFYILDDEYSSAVKNSSNRDLNETRHEHAGRIELLKKLIVNTSNELETEKMVFKMRLYHDSLKFFISSVISMTDVMAKCGQISEKYIDRELSTWLALFLRQRHCIPEAIIGTGNAMIPRTGDIKIFANGVFESMFERITK